MGYIMELRKIVGTRPLLMPGSCVIVLNEKGQLLLQLRKDNNCWGLAGGSLELGEELENAASRELFEETGLVAKLLELFNVYSGEEFYYQYPHGDEVYNVVAAYICMEYEGSLKKDKSEVQKLSFFHLNELPTNMNPPDIPIILDFIESKNRKA